MVRFRRRRWWKPLGVAAVVSFVAAGTTGPVAADPDTGRASQPSQTSQPSQARDRVADRLAGEQRRAYAVTLITGDKVHVGVSAGGAYTTRVEIAPRPGGARVFTQTLVGGGHVYVLPSDAATLVAAGRLDRRLFDVRRLAADGFTDARSASLPLIVQYGDGASGAPLGTAAAPPARARADAELRDRAGALPASRPLRALGSINAAAVSMTKREAPSLWSAIGGKAGATALEAGLSRVWLDGRVDAVLDQSVPMIGAPEAWRAGHDGRGVKVAVLDTGFDDTHADLTGKVVAAKSFVAGETVKDGHGHGTHVASTIAGSGAAAAGKYKGVAPGAGLVIGKVLGDGGSGSESSIIEGMEWATTSERARIVSMSLGTDAPTDGTDPLSQAVNDLSTATGALFVVAAGNSGPGASTVTSPGAADAALTVAAVDKSDRLADFSSRGPRIGDYALKPDIAAPGKLITAARATDTALGPIVDDVYTTISGTSMATPHVAGAAAILAQEHPGWTGEQIKAALAGTAKDDGFTVYEQGAGRVDIAAATRAAVVPATTKVDFGRLRFPHTGPAIAEKVTYRNTGATAVTLNLGVGLRAPGGGAAPGGMATVSPATLEVPAGGTADATVTLDPAPGPLGAYSGVVTATADGVSLRTPVGAYKESEGFDLKIRSVLPDQAVAAGVSVVFILRADRETGDWTIVPGGLSNVVHLDKGVYSVVRSVVWSDTKGDIGNQTLMIEPEVTLDRDTSITLDANRARPTTPQTGQATESYSSTAGIWRTPAGSTTPYGLLTGPSPYLSRTWVTPTTNATVGGFLFEHQYVLGTPLITATVAGRHGQSEVPLHPRYQHYSVLIPKLDGRLSVPVVDAGTGSAADFAKADVKGKAALINIGDKSLAPLLGTDFARQELANAARAGARAVFAYGSAGWPVLGRVPVPHSVYPVPTVALSAEEGTALRDRLVKGPAMLRINGRPGIPDVYALSFMERGSVPAAVRHTVRDGDLATIRPSFHSARPAAVGESWIVRRPTVFQPEELGAAFMTTSLEDLAGPTSRTERIGPLSATTTWERNVHLFELERFLEAEVPNHDDELNLGGMNGVDVFDRPIVRNETWMRDPAVPGVPAISPAAGELMGAARGAECGACRFSGLLPDGDMLPLFTQSTDGSGHYSQLTTYANLSQNPEHAGVDEWHLYRDGVELPQRSLVDRPGILPYYVLPPGRATYRLTEHLVDWQLLGGFGHAADTTWTFTSADPTGKDLPAHFDTLGLCADKCRAEPLIYLRYQLGLGMDNRLPAPGVHAFTVTAYRQPAKTAPPPLAGLRVSVSFDGGARWTGVPAVPLGGGRYAVAIKHPRPGAPTGTVSLRTEAWDAAGNRVVQTVPEAYGLVERH